MSSSLVCAVCYDDDIISGFQCPLCPQVMCNTCITEFFEAEFKDSITDDEVKVSLKYPHCPDKECNFIFTFSSIPKIYRPKLQNLTITLEKEFNKAVIDKITILQKLRKERERLLVLKEKTKSILPAGLRDAFEIVKPVRVTRVMKEEIKQSGKQFVKSKECPKASCKGLIELKTLQCNICEKFLCRECEELMENSETHICNKDVLKTLEELKKDFARCPKCYIPISKSFGCDHMWCTNCQTKFSYTSGEVINFSIQPEMARFRNTGQRTQVISHDLESPVDKDWREKTCISVIKLMKWLDDNIVPRAKDNLQNLQVKFSLEKITKEDYEDRILLAFEKDYVYKITDKILLSLREDIVKGINEKKSEEYLIALSEPLFKWASFYNKHYRTTFRLIEKDFISAP